MTKATGPLRYGRISGWPQTVVLTGPSMTMLLRCSLLVLGEHQDQQADKQPEKNQRNRLPEEVVHSPHLKPGPTLDRTEGPRYSADPATEGRGAPVCPLDSLTLAEVPAPFLE
jgi:hypothetical protein